MRRRSETELQGRTAGQTLQQSDRRHDEKENDRQDNACHNRADQERETDPDRVQIFQCIGREKARTDQQSANYQERQTGPMPGE